jgi:hypothetical protein
MVSVTTIGAVVYGQFVTVGAQDEIVLVTVFKIVDVVYGTEDEAVVLLPENIEEVRVKLEDDLDADVTMLLLEETWWEEVIVELKDVWDLVDVAELVFDDVVDLLADEVVEWLMLDDVWDEVPVTPVLEEVSAEEVRVVAELEDVWDVEDTTELLLSDVADMLVEEVITELLLVDVWDWVLETPVLEEVATELLLEDVLLVDDVWDRLLEALVLVEVTTDSLLDVVWDVTLELVELWKPN